MTAEPIDHDATDDPRAPVRLAALLAPLLAFLRARQPHRTVARGSGKGAYNREVTARALDDARHAHAWGPLWRAAAEGCGLGRDVTVAAGITTVIPHLRAVEQRPGQPESLRVELLPGQLPTDVTAVVARLAPALGAARVRVTHLGGHHVRLELLDHDPLAAVRHHTPDAARGLLGWTEDDTPLAVAWPDRGHTVVQGQTGSGKSVWTYGQLADAAADPAVLVTGIDPTGLLFRPFTDTRHAPLQVSGLSDDLAAHIALLERLTATMDDRIAAIPAHRDAVDISPDLPVLLVVLEELAGLYRAADLAGRDTGKRVRALVARLLSEGRKAGVRVLMIVQRADAAVVDGLARAQAALRVSFSVDSGEAVRMLHPAAVDPTDVLAAPPGVALATLPGTPLVRFRAPLLDYAGYADAVHAATRTAP